MTHFEQAHKVLELIAYRNDAVHKMVTTVAEIYGNDADLDEEAYAEKHETLKVLAEVCEETVDPMIDKVADVYVDNYTSDELDQLIAWYSSPLGKKTLDERRSMFTEITGLVEEWGKGLWKIVRLRRGFTQGSDEE